MFSEYWKYCLTWVEFISSYSSLLKHFSVADFLLIEGNGQGALQKEPVIPSFEE